MTNRVGRAFLFPNIAISELMLQPALALRFRHFRLWKNLIFLINGPTTVASRQLSLPTGDLPTGGPFIPIRKEIRMTKTQTNLHDVIRNSKHGFHQMDDRPGKPQKHRYERRKIRELLKSKGLAEADS
ncbi:MAG: hypothetical protein M2R45_03678 [Verrucomicrobia subdivision 3 bacterium]|nr:hypothetical protein [Limisphaerales bacterium]MCS1414961.1 hypothetical protein [Limisphaerales bacterium]